MTKTKAEIAQEIFEFNKASLRQYHEARERGDDKGYGLTFMHTDDQEIKSLVDDLCFEQQERERQRRHRREYFTMMLAIMDSGDKSFGIQELIER